MRDGRDGALGRQVFAVEMVDAAGAGVGGDEAFGELGDGQLHDASIPQSRGERKRRCFKGCDLKCRSENTLGSGAFWNCTNLASV